MKKRNSFLQKLEKMRVAEYMQSMLGDLSHSIAIERLGPWLTQRIFWRAKTSEKIIALSFDDGPNKVFTPDLLQTLDQYRVPATFFLIGQHVENSPAIAKEIANGPHEIGNHTFTHPTLPLLDDDEVTRELRDTHEIIGEVTGKQPTFMRPPMGLFTKRVVNLAARLGYLTVVGDVYPRDPHKPGAEKIIRRVLSRVQPGSLIILHDGGNTSCVDRSQTLHSVKTIVPKLLDDGYRFVTLSELVAANNGV
ncbi:MAG: polysaccharide deacetylase family protein [bacterium]